MTTATADARPIGTPMTAPLPRVTTPSSTAPSRAAASAMGAAGGRRTTPSANPTPTPAHATTRASRPVTTAPFRELTNGHVVRLQVLQLLLGTGPYRSPSSSGRGARRRSSDGYPAAR